MTAKQDSWTFLKQFTHARIALGRAGHSLPTPEVLDFRMAHSRARDSVWKDVDFSLLRTELLALSTQTIEVQSRCGSKQEFLLNPDLGRDLELQSKSRLLAAGQTDVNPDCLLVIADGLSANAVHANAAAFAQSFFANMQGLHLTLGPIILARFARVGLGDAIGANLKARSVLMLIGERPGLASSDSLSVYFTYMPSSGRTDADRNCISNIHGSGLSPDAAGAMSAYLVQTSLQKQLSGVDLKVEYPALINRGTPD